MLLKSILGLKKDIVIGLGEIGGEMLKKPNA